MPYRREPLEKYLNDAAAKLPAPGGGSVSALAGALGAAMGSMTAHFTLGKKKFRDVEPQVRAALEAFESARDRLAELMDEDTTLYEKVLNAYQLPKESEEDKRARDEAIQAALKQALGVPLEIVRVARKVAEAAASIVAVVNPMLITDMGVCSVLAMAACEGARLNVDVNLKDIHDAAFVASVASELSSHCAAALKAKAKVAGCIHAFLSQQGE